MKADEWEPVIFDEDKDPCKASKKLKESLNSNEQNESNNYENQELTTEQYPQNSYIESEPNISEEESELEEPPTPKIESFPVPLPRTYYSSTEKITLYEDGGLKVDIYNLADSSTYKVSARIYKNQILMDDNPATFEFNDHGELWLKFPDTKYIPLSSIPVK